MTSPNSLSLNNHLSKTLQQFADQYIEHFKKSHGHLPQVEHDDEWLSPCEQSESESGCVYWQPVAITKDDEVTFENVESALDLVLHADIKTYFTTMYSGHLDAQTEDGELSLLFAWNKADFERLQENLIGHILMKQRLKQAETVFFAVTDEADMIISVDNETGAVWVEQVGCKPHKKLTDSLAEFIAKLTPIANS